MGPRGPHGAPASQGASQPSRHPAVPPQQESGAVTIGPTRKKKDWVYYTKKHACALLGSHRSRAAPRRGLWVLRSRVGGWAPKLCKGTSPPPLHPARGDTHKTRTSPARGCPAWGAHAGGTALGGGRGRGATSWLGDRGQPGRWRSQFTRGCSESQSREARGEFLGLRRVQKERVSGGSKGEKIKKSLKKKKESLHEDKGRCVPVPPQPLQAA